ncbi:MAG: ABC transporter ATP-binding protein [Candidatus Tectomicrobia bacterium]|nr:ABC transporter ATP-binding protein [Candidatus Tectomicrobia bacterium]
MAFLQVNRINTFYGQSHILFDLSLAVNEGEVVCLLGRNGAGKTTTLRSIMGLTPPRSGSVIFRGQELVSLPPYLIAGLGLGYVPEDRRIFPNLTVWENLDVAQKSKQGEQESWVIERVFALFPQLRDLARHRGGHLSGGEQQMLTIARTLMGNPEVLLLDEPSEGLAPVVVQMLKEQLKKLKETGITMILAEQNVRFVNELGDRIYILEKGTVRYESSMQEFMANNEVRQTYLAV